MPSDVLIQQLIDHEGERLRLYRCPAGKLTIGVGRNIEDNGITREESRVLLGTDLALCQADLETFGWWGTLDPVRRDALIDMRLNLGPTRFRRFRRMLAALDQHDWPAVSFAMRDSQWAVQVGRRASRLMHMIDTGIR